MIVAGETSGDALGADLMHALRVERSDKRLMITGIGGPKMKAQGLASLFPMSEIALMGLWEILPKLPKLFKLINQTVAHALAVEPDVLVLIDSPEFNHRVAKRIKKQRSSIPVICYVAPQIWAWRRGRARKMAAWFDAIMAFLPFESEIFAAHGGPPCYFVGHPMIDRLKQLQPVPDFASLHGLVDDDQLLSVLPGSRHSEIKVLAPVFGTVVQRLHRNVPNLKLVMPVLPHTRDLVSHFVQDWPLVPILVEDDAEKIAAFQASRAALVASGTATIELALTGLPMVAAYNMGVVGNLVMRIAPIPSAILVNLILDRPLVPEFLQDRCNADDITPVIEEMLLDDGVNARLRHALSAFAPALSYEGQPPAQRAAAITLELANWSD